MKEQQFYICKHCGNIVAKVEDHGPAISCCGEEMILIEANTVDAAKEKHLPAVTVEGDKIIVNVGSVDHPMTKEHHISWVYLQTEHGGQRKNLAIDGKPHVTFTVDSDKPVAVYAYCNLHGLWETKL
ncbi:desulfoferrodoxin family protein [uncultured Sphaerochaeta sp.]|uniref:desulfoferrodoxin family protein n=1 Tax=uncultured Sphaerochaeta sp. TaxID=886478 RepID=UPI002A0A9904|nr:desulfoferrodoxin family protein [uncultured Sphaerochaeta sp.]